MIRSLDGDVKPLALANISFILYYQLKGNAKEPHTGVRKEKRSLTSVVGSFSRGGELGDCYGDPATKSQFPLHFKHQPRELSTHKLKKQVLSSKFSCKDA